MHSAVMRLMAMADDEGDEAPLKPMEVMLIAKGLDHLAHAQKLNADRILNVRKETAEKASKLVERELKKQPGLSADTIAAIRAKVLGVAA